MHTDTCESCVPLKGERKKKKRKWKLMMENKNNLKAFMSDLQTGIRATVVVAKVCCQFHCTWQKKKSHGQKQLEKPLKKKAKQDSPFLPPLQIFKLFFSLAAPHWRLVFFHSAHEARCCSHSVVSAVRGSEVGASLFQRSRGWEQSTETGKQ